MATKKTKHINRAFDEATREMASKFINAGKEFEGGFWKNRTLTSKSFGYGNWKLVPEQIQACINQIGRAASARARKAKKGNSKTSAGQATTQTILASQTGEAFVPEHFLEAIYDGVMKIPRNTSSSQLRAIRVYITERSGFDPKKVLLGIESRMEKSHTKHVH